MTYLLDTHTFLWFVDDSPKLPGRVKSLLENPDCRACISAVCLWEIAIKKQVGKLVVTKSISEFVEEARRLLLPVLPVKEFHCVTYEMLPLHHRDPFDRMLIAQALAEGYSLISNEVMFDHYSVPRIW